MPTYSYACTACDHRFDIVQAFTDNSLTVCPVCSGTLRKVFSSVGIVFKGSGFYRTDSRADAAKTASNGDGKGETKTDAAAKTDGATTGAAAKTDGAKTNGAKTNGDGKGAPASSSTAAQTNGAKTSSAQSPAKSGAPTP